tara:strand:- start:1448 stop:1720 length:273 start_codon:yes stop_codon:yes gene_type:complete
MKVGDLVTLSQYGSNLESLWRYHSDWREGKLVGLLTEIREGRRDWAGHKITYYTVQWINPKYKGLRRKRWAKPGHFKRNDLKMYKVLEKK